jgi:signal transduction histidine kinase/ActR/RegA family two-component response regulator
VKERLLRLPLASKLLILSVVLIMGISVLFWYPSILHIQQEELGKNIDFAESQMDVIERALYYGMLTNNREFIRQTIESLGTMDNILWIRIIDAGGTVRFSSTKGEFNVLTNLDARVVPSKLPEKRALSIKELKGQKTIEMVQPVHNMQPCYSAACHVHSKDLRILGRIEYGYSLKSVDAYIKRQGYTMAAFGFVFIAVLSMPLYLIVNRFVLKPVGLLTEGIHKVAVGDLSHTIELDTKDELGMLASSFNSMTKQLQERNVATAKELDDYRLSLLHAQKMEAIGTLSAGIAHDFNNILTGIIGYTELVREESDQPVVKEYVGRVLELTDKASEFTKQILLIGRKVPPARRPLDINHLIDDSMKMLRRMVEENIEIRVFKQANLPEVEADHAQITQVLMNLVVNARDAMPGGGVIEIRTGKISIDEVYSKLHAYPKPGNYVIMAISDTGSGIPEEIRDKMFEPFFTTKEKGKGTGLGLAVTYSIIKGHGGWIDISSETGKGTEFRVYLPMSSAHAETAPRTKPAHEKVTLPGGTENVLLVDDDPVIKELGKSLLEDLGYKVFIASDGDEAVKIYEEKGEEIALVIMDRVMPRVDGLESYKRLKKINPIVKVIISSGYAADEAKHLKESGVAGFLDKPYRMAQMANAVREAIDGSESRHDG